MPQPSAPSPVLRILEGDCWVFFSFDVGHAIDLDRSQSLLKGASVRASGASAEEARREEIGRPGPHRRIPTSFQFRPPPLRIEQSLSDQPAVEIAGFHSIQSVECTLFEFGAISVAYRFPIGDESGRPLNALLPLSQALFDNAPLREDATRRVSALIQRLAPAIDKRDIASTIEDYTVYHAKRWACDTSSACMDASAAIQSCGESVARLLLGEGASADLELSPAAIDSTLATMVSYSRADAAVIDWNAAIILGPDEEDALAVLEFANVELLEMRFLDDRLDAALDVTYSSILKKGEDGLGRRSPLGLLTDPHRDRRRRLAALQMENVVLFEGVNNAIKLVGDQHLARLYAAAAKRFHLADWDESILRKLHTIDGLYQKLADEQAARRMEVLEWIVIILIAVSIVLPFVPGVGK